MSDVDDVVAIVQGLQDAGLAVTVLNRRLLRNRNPYRKPRASRSSVETNTENSYRESFVINRGTSVRDGHYASSYQIAHCSARPTSPPQNSPEFPPQRLRPSRTDGNFEVGGNCGVWETLASPSRRYRLGNTDRSPDRGSRYMNYSESLSHERFAHSLRRYPSYSPERSLSSELVQKILSYTQNKYLPKATSKSQRSLNREKSPQSLKLEVKSSKNIQTYTRSRREVCTRDCGANTSHDLKFMPREGRSYSTIKDKYRYKSEGINSSYDYLEYPPRSRRVDSTNEVRYLRDVKKYIRNTIRQMYDDKPTAVLQVCPKIRNRYFHHRKMHHKGQNDQTCQSIQGKAQIPSTSKSPIFTHCEPSPGSHLYSNHVDVNTFGVLCCNCHKPKPCACELKAKKTADAVKQHITDWVNELPVYTENTKEDEREKEQVIKELGEIISKIPKDENHGENLKKAIQSCIEDLPMWHPATKDDETEYKNDIIDSLTGRLHTPEEKMTDAVKGTVQNWLNDIPLDRNIDTDKTTNSFASHLTPLLNDVDELKVKLKELLGNLPITNKNEVIRNIQDDFANDLNELLARSDAPGLTDEELENEVNEFLEVYPDILDQGEKVKNLVRKLKNAQSKPISTDVKEEEMKNNIVNWIDTLPKSIRDNFTPIKKEEFSNDLVNKVQSAANFKAKATDRKSSLQTQNEIEDEIWDILESMDVGSDDIEKSAVKKFAMNLKEIEKSDIDEEAVANETSSFLNELDKSGISMRSRDQDKFQDKVLGKLKRIQAKERQSSGGRRTSFVTSTPRKGNPSSRRGFNVSSIGEDENSFAELSVRKNAQKQYNDKITDQIESWVDSLPINLDGDKKLKKAMVNDLASDIMDRQKYLQIHPSAAKSDAEELENMKYQVFRWLNKMDDVKDHEMAPVMEKTKSLMDKIKNVEVPQFNRSGLRSPTEEKRSGSAIRQQSGGSTTRNQSFGNKTNIPTQDASMFIKENLDGAITDWIKQLPLYEKANQEQKRKFEEVIPEISKGIKRVYDGIDNLDQDIDKLVTDEIGKQMKNFPLSSEDKRDDKFMTQTAAQLLQYLKDQQMFEDISERKNVPYDQYLKQQVDDWANSFSLTRLSSAEKMEFKDLKDEFISKLKQAREGRIDEEELKSEINKYLKKFPLKESVKSNTEYQDRKVEELIKALSTLPIAADSRFVPDVHDSVRKAIANWIQKLPLDAGKTVADIPEDAVENMAKIISDVLIHTDEIPINDVKNTIQDATVSFLDEIPLDPEKKQDTQALADNLFENVKDIPKDAMRSTPTLYGVGSSKGNARVYETLPTNELKTVGDNLTGAILDWMKQQPAYIDKKAELDKLAPDLSKNVKSILKNSKGEDQDKVLIDEMTVKFKDTPLKSTSSGDAAQLVQYLKDLQMLQDTDATTTVDIPLEDIENTVHSFVNNNLDLQKGTWAEKEKFGKLKSELDAKLKELIDNNADEDTIKKEIQYYMSRFPLSEDERRDNRFLEKKAEDLLESLPIQSSPDVYSYVRKGAMKWMKSLPLDRGKNINDIPKQAIDQITRRLSDHLIHTDVVSIAETKKVIEEETNKFLQNTPLDKNKPYDSKKMAKELFDYIKIYSKDNNKASSKDKSTDISPTSTKEYFPVSTKERLSASTKESIPTSTEALTSNKAGSMYQDQNKVSSKDKTTKDSILTSPRLSTIPTSTEVLGSNKAGSMYQDQNKVSSKDKTTKDSTLTSPRLSTIPTSAEVLGSNKAGSMYQDKNKVSSKDKTTKSSILTSPRLSTIPTSAEALISNKAGSLYQDKNKGSSKDKSGKVSTIPTSAEALMSNKTGSVRYQDKHKALSKDNTTKGPLSTSTKVSKATSAETLLSNKSGSMHPSLKSAADQLADNIEQWVNNLPIKENTPEEKSKASDLRRYLSSKIITKVGELNTNPEIFNDDFLYEEMFEDEVDNMIAALSSDDLRSKMPPHKKNLIEIVKSARLKTQEEMAGPVYKQQLREVVSKTVPAESLNEEEIASFEVLKEDVADAFVSLHHVRGDAESKNQFKNNVKGEIDGFCADYLKSHSKAAIDTEKLNSDLYKALKDVPVPKDKTMRHEIEIIKIKEVINQWINEGKLFGDQTGAERLKTKKRISVLAKKIHDIEKLKESNPDFDSDGALKKDIKKWLEKMPLVVKTDLDELAEQLIKKLKETEESRRLLQYDSSGRDSILPASSYSNGPWSSPADSNGGPRSSSHPKSGRRLSGSTKSLRRSIVSTTGREGSVTPGGSRRGTADASTIPGISESTTAETSTAPEFTIVPSPCAPPCAIPSSFLSPEDREYLRKIRERVTLSLTQSSPRSSKDAAVSPIPVDYSSQTEILSDKTTTTPQAQSTPQRAQTSCCQTSETGMQTAGSQAEIVPNVIVKEYFWDSVNSTRPCPNLSATPPTPCTPCRQTPEVPSPRPCYACPPRASQHAQTPPPCLKPCDPVCREYPPFVLDLPEPCSSRCKRIKHSNQNVGPRMTESNRNLSWSKEDFYGDRREPSDEEGIADMGRRKKRCRCKERLALTCHNMKNRNYKPCTETVSSCAKCCGVHCPFPSYLYFKR